MLQKLKPLFVVRKLKKENLIIFSPLDFKRLFDVSQDAAQWFIKTHTKKGLFLKLRNGLYHLADEPLNHYLIANRLYQPSYISFETALSFHQIIPETVYTITSTTSRASRKFTVEGVEHLYHKIKKKAYTGYGPINYLGQIVMMADPEKALADYFYFVDLNKHQFSYDRLNLEKLKKSKLFFYLKVFGRPSLENFAKQIYNDNLC